MRKMQCTGTPGNTRCSADQAKASFQAGTSPAFGLDFITSAACSY